MSNVCSAVHRSLVLVALVSAFSAASVTRAQIVIPFPFFTPISECGKVGFVPSTFFEGELCKVWFAQSGGAFLVAGLEPFDEGDEVFVDGLICNTCLTTCLAGAIFNATVTAGCDSGRQAAISADIVVPNEANLYELTGGEDFFLTNVEFGIIEDQVVITQAGVNSEEPRTFNLEAHDVQVATQAVFTADQGLGVSNEHAAVTEATVAGIEQGTGDTEFVSTVGEGVLLPVEGAAAPLATEPTGAIKPPFDCSTCLESFCGGTLHCVLVDCDTFCEYACTWVICDPNEIPGPIGPLGG